MNAGHSVIVRRLQSGDDFRISLETIIKEQNIRAGVLLSAVGSLTLAVLRTSSGTTKTFQGPLEIVSATGTMGSGGLHIHLSVANEDGTTFGGHLLPGCIIRTTAEIAIHDLSVEMVFERKLDHKTGYLELVVRSLNN
jgi:predicted DNA-binding protein with PD1-like motif